MHDGARPYGFRFTIGAPNKVYMKLVSKYLKTDGDDLAEAVG